MIRRRVAAVAAVAVLSVSVILHTDAPAEGVELDRPTSRTVAACATDEGADGQGVRPCVWDARHLGNGHGRSFIVRRDGRVQYLGHRRAHALIYGGGN